MKPLIFAHRGASGSFPENTLKAFQQAVKANADGVTLSVQLSKDFIPVLIHDRTVNRTTDGQGLVSHYTANELKQLNAAAHHNAQIREPVLLLEDCISWLKDQSKLQVVMELRSYNVNSKQLLDTIIPLVDQEEMKHRVVLASYDHILLSEIKTASHQLTIAPLMEGRLWDAVHYLNSMQAKSYFLGAQYVSRELVHQLEEYDMSVGAHSTNDTLTLKKLMNTGIATIFSDFPARAIHVRDHL
ncbi:glycerophosphoryl diester phosphodiesterase [Alkalihalobacillus xiaoxiensis]|uniref:Glycerophosphoryl diester phosphodiesterase n=1 Tax=Shouchella xiaoxiensis TaxID=766895 RepID=A0ABS2SR02_9BACI|nr:glycerophosphodiester phosphodiesterase family protein [Shouchella xiaoxiensis]MBM7837932.1 glycerophosphoryl diester phosphodiesterase [Shouchella xiaoxiensis]